MKKLQTKACKELRTFTRILQGGASDLGWVDLDLESFPGWWAAYVVAHCAGSMVEYHKVNQTQIRDVVSHPTAWGNET